MQEPKARDPYTASSYVVKYISISVMPTLLYFIINQVMYMDRNDYYDGESTLLNLIQIGDETFIIAALMAMRHPKSNVLSGALSALVVMMILSTGLGIIVPNLISRKHTNSAATVLYAFFGLRLLYIAWRSDSKASQKKEMEEALPITFGDRQVYIEEKRTSTRGYRFYEGKNKKAKRIVSQFDESCSPKAPRQG
ncbi:hypothetical protein IFM89_015246, partial [Coptis chinensis]